MDCGESHTTSTTSEDDDIGAAASWPNEEDADGTVYCDYCDESYVGQIPRGWVVSRLMVRPPQELHDPEYVQGPITCSFHTFQMRTAYAT